MTQPKLILASGSVYKQGALRKLGYPFEIDPADIEELELPDETPAQMAERLSIEKAEFVAKRQPGAFVIGGDQVVALGNDILRKPESKQGCIEQLSKLSGKAHDLISGVALCTPDGQTIYGAIEVKMQMRTLTEREIITYVEEDMPLDCAGSYRIEANGVRLFRSMLGTDHTAIVGMPMTKLHEMLEDTGFVQAYLSSFQ